MKFSSAHTLRTSNAREGEASNERQQQQDTAFVGLEPGRGRRVWQRDCEAGVSTRSPFTNRHTPLSESNVAFGAGRLGTAWSEFDRYATLDPARTSTVNSVSNQSLSAVGFMSYPGRYPCPWRAGVGQLGIGWARMSGFVKDAGGTMTHETRTVARRMTAS